MHFQRKWATCFSCKKRYITNMKKMIAILNRNVPAPAPGDLMHRDRYVILAPPGTSLPEGFPNTLAREQILKESGSVAAFLNGNGQLFCKIYKYRSFLHSLKRTFRTPRAFRCFTGAQLLAKYGFYTPQPAAAAVCYKGPVPLHQILITQSLPGNTVYLDKAIAQMDCKKAGELLCAVTEFAAKLHQAGFVHGDMSLRNIYLLPDGKSFGMIDLDAISHYSDGVPRRAAAQEAARLISSAYRCCLQPDIPREEWLQNALQSYRAAGGADLQKQDIAGTLARLAKHRPHQVKKS